MNNSNAILRKQAHQQAQKYIQKDDFHKAISIMESAVKDFGPHVGLLCDLSSCYYMTNEFSRWKNSISTLIKEFIKAEQSLSEISILHTIIKLGNFYEELAQPNMALEFYEKAKNLNPSPLILSSLARCRVFLNQSRKIIAPLYTETINTLQKENYNTSAEIDHNLILVEASLIGFSSAIKRLEIIKKEKHRQSDFHLILYDLYELALIKKEDENMSLLQDWVQKSNPTSNFEKYLKNYHSSQLSLIDTIELEKQLSLANFLQILALEINKNPKNLEIKTKLQLLIDGLPTPARLMYLKKWELIIGQQTLYLDLHKKTIANEQNKISLHSKKLIFLSIKLLCKENTCSKEQFVKKIYGAEYNNSYHHRIRELVKRINLELSSIIGNLSTITYNNTKLNLNKKITIKTVGLR
ncbi:MAG: hypothetical protein HAW60_02730 [Bdellovibrionales bacterium]|nr:hypothetical protein [Bdellovibrionales bacterium]